MNTLILCIAGAGLQVGGGLGVQGAHPRKGRKWVKNGIWSGQSSAKVTPGKHISRGIETWYHTAHHPWCPSSPTRSSPEVHLEGPFGPIFCSAQITQQHPHINMAGCDIGTTEAHWAIADGFLAYAAGWRGKWERRGDGAKKTTKPGGCAGLTVLLAAPGDISHNIAIWH